MSTTKSASHRNRMLKLGRGLPKPVSDLKWDEINSAVNVHLPSSSDIVEEFGSWEDFLIECGFPSHGLYNEEFIRQYLDTLEKVRTQRCGDAPFYSGAQKQATRERMVELAADKLSTPAVKYVGLPSPNFIDYILLHEYGLALLPEHSLAVQRGQKEANATQSIIRYWSLIEGGEVFRGLRFFRGWLHEALRHSRFSGMRFNFANFDFVGSWDYTKRESIDNLFGQEHVDDEALLFVTLNDSRKERNKLRSRKDENNRKYGHSSDNQTKIVIPYVSETAKKHGYRVEVAMDIQYKDNVPMITVGFRLRRPQGYGIRIR